MQPNDADREERPPVGGSWTRLYAIVLGALAVEVLIFYWFTRALQ
ncbi:MAG TPA: hypothetical protein VGE86_01385 [Thermoanaerobaculia bacterium]